jgi:hypothetical protein
VKQNRPLLVFYLCFAGSGAPHSRQGREEKEKAGQIRPFLALPTAAREGTDIPSVNQSVITYVILTET